MPVILEVRHALHEGRQGEAPRRLGRERDARRRVLQEARDARQEHHEGVAAARRRGEALDTGEGGGRQGGPARPVAALRRGDQGRGR